MFGWHIITGEYPPQPGGVGDYTRLLAWELAKLGDEVEVWVPKNLGAQPHDAGVRIHRLPGHFGPRALAIVDRAISRTNSHRVLVQYVPHAFGWKGMNLPFCCWLFARRRLDITVMFHEVAFRRRVAQPLRHNLLGEVTSLMAKLVARSATRIFVACDAWERMLQPMLPASRSIMSLPVPSNVPVVSDVEATNAIRARYASAGVLVAGHFSTYAPTIREYLEVSLPDLLHDPRLSVILLGRGALEFRELLARRHPAITARLHAPGELASEQVSAYLSACDLMIQPYPDGISTRRTSAMAGLSHGRPIVTTNGRFTEPLWISSRAVATVPDTDLTALAPLAISLLDDDSERQRLGLAASKLYRDRFDLRHTISCLRATNGCGSR
jgi:glycosyltransferase involved in cell wall biosynthesis